MNSNKQGKIHNVVTFLGEKCKNLDHILLGKSVAQRLSSDQAIDKMKIIFRDLIYYMIIWLYSSTYNIGGIILPEIKNWMQGRCD